MKIKIIVISAFLALLITFLQSKNPPCNMEIEIENGNVYDVKQINYYNSGFADIHLCNGERIIVQTDAIDTIKYIQ